MHFEILVEDQSGKVMLDHLVPRLLGPDHSFRVIAYKGIGHIPRGMKTNADPAKRILLDRLPSLLRGYGRSLAGIPAAVIVVCDLDDRCLKAFRAELLEVVSACDPAPTTRFCIAIEEGEAWLLGDLDAVREAYPKAREQVLRGYANDAICGTWELLAEAVHAGGVAKLKSQGWQAVGAEKTRWAHVIASRMEPEQNRSPSFRYFCSKLAQLSLDEWA